jgi:hypothetical protein
VVVRRAKSTDCPDLIKPTFAVRCQCFFLLLPPGQPTLRSSRTTTESEARPMFPSILRPQKGRSSHSERAPLLAALSKFRFGGEERSASEDDEDDGDIAQYDGEDDEDDHARHGQRDGPLLPVFSSEVLGMQTYIHVPLLCLWR